MNARAAIGALSVVAASLVFSQLATTNQGHSAAAVALADDVVPSAATRCSGVHGIASQPVPVAKTADGSWALALVQWGYNSAARLCYLVIDNDAAQVLRERHANPRAEGDPTVAATCSATPGWASDAVPVLKSVAGEELAYIYWGFNPSARTCYLTLDQAATATMRAWHSAQEGLPGSGAPKPGPAAGDFGTVSAGGHHGAHACALERSKALSCWGSNYSGQSDPPKGEYVAVDAGGSHSCAVRTDGAAVCWGDNSVGQSSPPEGEFTAIATGSIHSCGVRTDRAAVCWGKNNAGQGSPPEGDFTAVVAGGYHSCGLLVDGSAVCWGQGSLGQSNPPEGEFTAIASGWYHSCALRAAGVVVCWGDNSRGQGDVPAGRYTDVAAGGEHSCAVTIDGAVVCWGNDYAAQTSPPPGQYLAVDAGEDLTCGVRRDQAVICWGNIGPSAEAA